jgi:NAD(P)-dependent dehydrogenase (short-subunit alcohol dehydrogenase family)
MWKALITWGTKGIWFAIAKELARKGHDIVLTYYHDSEVANQSVQTLRGLWVDAQAIQADTANKSDLEAIFAQSKDITILINNIGSSFIDWSGQDWHAMFNYHMMGTVYSTELFASNLKWQWSIVNISSNAWSNPWAWYKAMRLESYCCMKAAVNMYTKICANKYAGDIRVNAVSPWNTDTPWREWGDQDFIDTISLNSCINRFIDPHEIAQAVSAVVENRWINGQIITVDGWEVARGYEST